MGEKIVKALARPYFRGTIIVLLCLVAAIAYFDWRVGIAAAAISIIFLVFCYVIFRKQLKWIQGYLEKLEEDIEETIRYSVRHNPIPICIVDESGKVAIANDQFREIYPDVQILKTEISELTGKTRTEFLPEDSGDEEHTEQPVRLTVGGKTYNVISSYLNGDTLKTVQLYWIDITNFENLKERYAEERKCIAHVQVDNYDELIASSPDEKKSLIAANIDTTIRQWGGKLEASITKYTANKYCILFEYKYFEQLAEGKFAILDEIRSIETDADFPVTLSIGVGASGKSPVEVDEYAAFALDLALGRGGDQAVVKRGNNVDYYGGKVQVLERRNKGKSRVMAHAIRQLMDQSSRVIIMGHRNPDMDSLGAAIGMARLAKERNRDAYIIINGYNHSMTDVYHTVENTEEYNLIGTEAALGLMEKDALLIVVDTHRPSLTEAPELISRADKIIVIDHHRKTEEFIENATLTYMDPAASSTSELIAEILQYMTGKKRLTRMEAELLLGGIIVDTNSFSIKTGARTFEAASWLRMNGADTAIVRQMLQSDMEDFKQRASIITNAEFLPGGIAISKSEGINANAQIVNAQAADELLDIKGIRASFVAGQTDTEVAISARSLGEINVQRIMEKMGGGGHLTMAAAQITTMTVDETIQKLKTLIQEVEGENKS